MKLKFIPLGLSPIFQQKQNPFAAAAAIGAVGGLGTSLVNYFSQQSANKSNEWNVAQTNEMNERLFHEQLQWNEDMTKKYGTPEAQLKSSMQAYKELGLNPNLMLGNGGQSGQVPISVNPPKMEAAQAIAPQFNDPHLGQYFSQAALSKAQAENLQASTDAQNIRNRYLVTKELLDIQEQLSRKDLTDVQRTDLETRRKIAEIELQYQDDFMQARNESQKQDAALKRSEAALNAGKIEYQNYMNKAFPATSEAQMRLMNAQVFNLIQSGLAAGASIEQIKANCAKLMADKLNVEQDTLNKKQQYNVNKPNEILSGKESKDLNNDPKENDIYHGLDMLFKYVLPLKRMFK